jgi:hypothetical protein
MLWHICGGKKWHWVGQWQYGIEVVEYDVSATTPAVEVTLPLQASI